MMPRARLPRFDDRGLTLVELIISSFLMIGVVAFAGWMLVSALTGGRDVTVSNSATSQAQLLADSVVGALRQSDGVTLGAFDADGQILRATHHTFDAEGNEVAWERVAWAITADGRAYTLRSCSAIDDPTGQSVSDFAGWLLLATGLEPVAVGTPILAPEGSGVAIEVKSDAYGGTPAYVEASVTPHQLPSTVGTGTC